MLIISVFFFAGSSESSLQAQWVINGTTTSLGGDCFQLTNNSPSQAGSVFSQNTINLNQPFNESVIANFGCSDGGADGIVFLFTTSNTALGIGGGGIGYQGITPSFAVEFDTWQNGDRGDPTQDHAAIISDGVNDHNAASNLDGPVTLGNIEDCMDHCVEFSWDPSTQTFSVTFDGTPILSYTGNIANNFLAGVSNVFWGFTASTGGAFNVHTVCLGPPTLDPMEDVTICQGESAQLQADPNGIAWDWAFDPTLSALDISNPMATPSLTTTYDVTITYECNFSLTDDVTVFVNPPPAATASNNSPICDGETLTLFANGGVSYNWSGPAGFGSSQQNPVIMPVTPANAGLYSVTVTDASGCTNVATTNVVINPLPIVSIVPPGNICADEALVILTGTPFGGTWGGIADANGFIYPITLGSGFFPVTYTYTDANGCTNLDIINVLIFPTPVVNVFPIGPLCESDGIQQLLAEPPGGIWGGDADPSGLFDPAMGPGSYTVTYTYTDFNNCTASNQFDILVLPATPITIDPIGPFCESDSLFIATANPPGGSWGGDVGPNGEIDPAALGAGTYTATYDFDQPGLCPASESITFEIFANPVAEITDPGSACEDEAPFFLTGNPAGGIWSGVADSQGQIDPGLLGPGTYLVGYFYATPAGCSDSTSLQIVIDSLPMVSINPAGPFCEDDPVQTLSAIPPGGVWGGVATNTGQIVPSNLGPGEHIVTYVYTNMEGCSDSAQITVVINPIPNVSIDAAGPFCEDAGIQTLTATPPGGSWGGLADSLGQIDPSTLGQGTYTVSYSYTDSTGCGNSDQINIQINNVPDVQISPAGPFCEDEDIQQLTAIPPNGNWGGAANSLGQFDPALLGPGQHEATYSFTTAAGCQNADTILVSVFEVPTATISGGDTICQGSGSFADVIFDVTGTGTIVVTYAINGVQEPPLSIDTTTFILQTNTPGIYTIIQVSDDLGCVNTGSGSAEVLVVGAPQALNPEITCSADNLSYTFTFEISGGDSSSYSVNGNPGMITNTSPFIFTSDPIASGDSYSFQLTDAFGCDTIILAGIFSCDCTTQAGDMGDTALSVCAQDTAFASYDNTTEVTDGNDQLLFALHTQSGPVLGTVLAWNTVPVFTFDPNTMSFGVTYYISAVLGNEDGMGGIDLNDPCLSVAPGTPVIFQPIPTASVSGDGSICQGDSLNLQFNFTGNGPFDVSFTNGMDTFLINDIPNGTLEGVSPDMTTVFTILSVGDNSLPQCLNSGGDSAVVTVNLPAQTNQSSAICQKDSIFLGGAFQYDAGLYFDTLSTLQGCDSVIITELTVNLLDTTYLFDTSCDPGQVGITTQTFNNALGCDSLIITQTDFVNADTTYLSSNSCNENQSGVFVTFLTNQLDCDSVVIETVTYIPPDTTYLFGGDCNVNNTGIFTEVLPNQFGCDSLIISTISLLESDTTYLTAETCDPDSAGIFNTLLVNADGCDSLIIETVDLLPSDTTYLFNTTCEPDSAGVFSSLLDNQFGCDSLVIETVDLLPSDTTLLFNTTCNPGEAGIFTMLLDNQFGCDSLVIETVDLLPSDTTFLFDTSCEPDETGIFSTLLSNQFGCDSLVIETVDLLPSDTTYLFDSSCDPDEAGVFTMLLDNQFGCDSLVIETIDLLPSDTTFLFDTTCDPGQAGVFETLLTNQFGCDSLVVESVDLLPSDTTTLFFESCNPQDTGTISTLLINQFGCDSLVLVITTLSPPSDCVLDALLTGSDLPCGVPAGSIFIELNNGLAPYDYSWTGTGSPASGSGTFNDNQPQELTGFSPGLYNFTITSSDGLSTSLQAEIVENFPPAIDLLVTSEYAGYDLSCADSQDGAAEANILSGGAPPYTYAWSNGAPEAQVDSLGAGWIYVTITDAKNCEAVDSALLIAPSPVVLDATTRDLDCSGFANGRISLEPAGGAPPYRYRIDDLPWQDDPTFDNLAAGSYLLEVEDANGCSQTTTAALTAPEPLLVELGDDKFIELGDSVLLDAQTNFPFPSLDTIIWGQVDSLDCAGCPEIFVSPQFTHIYEVFVQALNGCVAEDRITVFVNRERKVYIPTAFTPDGDGANDIFTVFADQTASRIKTLRIFNRWGDKVFEGNDMIPGDLSTGWDGWYRNQKLNPAVFVYYAEVEFFDGQVEVYKGSVTLVR